MSAQHAELTECERRLTQGRLPMWGQDFILPPAFQPAFFGRSRDAGQKPGGRPKGLTPLLNRVLRLNLFPPCPAVSRPDSCYQC